MKSRYYPEQRPWTLAAAETLLNLSGGDSLMETLGAQQLKNAVALQHMLLNHGVAYLADEVGMGKTYVALAVVSMFRHINPGFRVLYIAPSGNVRQKWVEREYTEFMERNIRVTDLRVRSFSRQPANKPLECDTLDKWLESCTAPIPELDAFISISTLSFPLSENDPTQRRQRIKELAAKAKQRVDLQGVSAKETIKERAAELVNKTIPVYDLVVIDEAHLLKGGMGSSNRVTFLSRILGTNPESGGALKFRGALLLSATPFDRDISQLFRQIEIVSGEEHKNSPRDRLKSLLTMKSNEEGYWERVQNGLKPFMVRCEQRLAINGTTELTRNQYRLEHRTDAHATISLKGRTDKDAIKQRLFTSLIQKRLIDYCDSQGGVFPPAMFASFEAYTLPSSPLVNKTVPDSDDSLPNGADAMDIGEEHSSSGSSAFDGELIKSIVGEHIRKFNNEPPHPKLQEVSRRLHEKAFQLGRKQLVFVRRIKSVEDLKRRLEERYDQEISAYLEKYGMATTDAWLSSLKKAQGGKRPEVGIQSMDEPIGVTASSESIPSSKETIFSWFFRGPLDVDSKQFADNHSLRAPLELRNMLTDQQRWSGLIGELDWKSWVCYRAGKLDVDISSIADLASESNWGSTRYLHRHRQLQNAWLVKAAEATNDSSLVAAIQQVIHYQKAAFNPSLEKTERPGNELALKILDAPTLPFTLYRQGLGTEVLPVWERTWDTLLDPKISDVEKQRALRRLDLHCEIMFSLIRLDHPFIDLYIAAAKAGDDIGGPEEIGIWLQHFTDIIKSQDPKNFCTRRILGQLSEGWDYMIKTNFAQLLRPNGGVDRLKWRTEILNRIAPHAPIDWASGDNAKSRPAIARRFRMPGYPMVLVSTSVLQEGEDLHIFCDSVTHYGVSGSPIGIEQKNGRVDRVGALSHRAMQRDLVANDTNMIHVFFPHLPESLEWFQLRDLCFNLNEYLHSLHQIRGNQYREKSLVESFSDTKTIPGQIFDQLVSPFRPDLDERTENPVTPRDVTSVVRDAKSKLKHANRLLKAFARRLKLLQQEDLPDRYVNDDESLSLQVLPVPSLGELLISGTKILHLSKIATNFTRDNLVKLGKIPYWRYARVADDKFVMRADCIAQGVGVLQEEELHDIAARLGIEGYQFAPAVDDGRLLKLLKSTKQELKKIGFEWDEKRKTQKIQHLYFGNRKIYLEKIESWLEISTVINEIEDHDIVDYIFNHNDNNNGIGYYLDSYYRVRARVIQPLKFLQKEELICMCKMLVRQIVK